MIVFTLAILYPRDANSPLPYPLGNRYFILSYAGEVIYPRRQIHHYSVFRDLITIFLITGGLAQIFVDLEKRKNRGKKT